MATDEKRFFTTAELSRHNTRSDLWISIQGKVYDVTPWLDDHPGGDLPLLHLAGQDVTDAFIAYHPGSVWSSLDRFLIGRLSDYQVSEISKDYRRLITDFSKAGLFERKGHVTLFTLVAIAVFFSAAVTAVLRSERSSVRLLAGGLVGVVWTLSGWLGHDSGHYRAMPSARLNRAAQILTGNCLAGISIGWWKRNHNAHHIACNSLEYDPDVQHMPIFAVSSKQFETLKSFFYDRMMNFDAVSRILISYQHYTFYPVMCFARVNLFAQSIMVLVQKKVPNRTPEFFGILVFWVWYPILVSRLPDWKERVLFVVFSFAVTGIQHIQFCLNHFSSSVYLGKPKGNDWFEKQTTGTMNIDCEPWMDWFHGGLQFQVEHHLFPRLPRCNLRKISPFVREMCKKHGLSYDVTTFWGANVRIVSTLRAAALQARKVGKDGMRNLVWEAVNTHG